MKLTLSRYSLIAATVFTLAPAAVAADLAQAAGQRGDPQTMEQTPPGAAETPRFVEVQTGKSGVRYVTGGVGDNEQSTLKQLYGDYGLMLVNVAKPSGAYVADVAVTVRDAGGQEIIETTTNGPWLIADLPPGRYVIEANFAGDKQTRRVSIGKEGRQQRVVMRWAEAMG